MQSPILNLNLLTLQLFSPDFLQSFAEKSSHLLVLMVALRDDLSVSYRNPSLKLPNRLNYNALQFAISVKQDLWPVF
jgi:hypothetical protein